MAFYRLHRAEDYVLQDVPQHCIPEEQNPLLCHCENLRVAYIGPLPWGWLWLFTWCWRLKLCGVLPLYLFSAVILLQTSNLKALFLSSMKQGLYTRTCSVIWHCFQTVHFNLKGLWLLQELVNLIFSNLYIKQKKERQGCVFVLPVCQPAWGTYLVSHCDIICFTSSSYHYRLWCSLLALIKLLGSKYIFLCRIGNVSETTFCTRILSFLRWTISMLNLSKWCIWLTR